MVEASTADPKASTQANHRSTGELQRGAPGEQRHAESDGPEHHEHLPGERGECEVQRDQAQPAHDELRGACPHVAHRHSGDEGKQCGREAVEHLDTHAIQVSQVGDHHADERNGPRDVDTNVSVLHSVNGTQTDVAGTLTRAQHPCRYDR